MPLKQTYQYFIDNMSNRLVNDIANGVITKLGAINPYWYPPRTCQWFDLIADAVITNSEATLVDFTLPIASIGTIRWFGQKVCTPITNWDAITWSIRINGGPDVVYGTIVGEISDFIAPLDIMIKLNRGDNIKLIASTTSASSIHVIGRLKGWYWPEDMYIYDSSY